MNYLLVTHDIMDTDGLEREVKERINDGWRPFGGPSINGRGIVQAMVKEDDDGDNDVWGYDK